MHLKQFLLGLGVHCAAAVLVPACLQNGHGGGIRLEYQLPPHIFPELRPEPLTMELALPGGMKTLAIAPARLSPREQAAEIIRQFETHPSGSRSQDDRMNYAVALVVAGRYLEAAATLRAIELDFPGQYATASNLGTTYELLGNVDAALKWIREGIKRNPDSHAGTEWLHVAILETKKKLKEDPRWLQTHSVLDGHENRSPADREKALEYQLNERLNFITENDPVMFDLFSQAARITGNPAKREYYLGQRSRFQPVLKAGIATPIPVGVGP